MNRVRLRISFAVLGVVVAACGGVTALGPGDGGTEISPDGTSGTNACGGTAALSFEGGDAAPGDPCGPCGDGVLACATSDALTCAGGRPASACSEGGAPVDATLPDASSQDAAMADATSPDSASREASIEAGSDGGLGWQVPDSSTPTTTTYTDGGLPSVTCLSMAVGGLVWNPHRAELYALVPPNQAGPFNGVVRIDPSIPAVTGMVTVGYDPDAFALTDDGVTLYVGDDLRDTVIRVDTGSGALGSTVHLGAGPWLVGPRTTVQIAAVPGSASSFAVSTATSGSFEGLLLYDGVTKTGEWDGFEVEPIAFTSSTRLWGYDNTSTGFTLFGFDVGANGLQDAGAYQDVISGFEVGITAQGGWIFATSGQVASGDTGLSLGQYPATGAVWPDPNGADVWFLGPSVFADYDRNTFIAKKSYPPPPEVLVPQRATALMGIGPSRLAFSTYSAVCVVTLP